MFDTPKRVGQIEDDVRTLKDEIRRLRTHLEDVEDTLSRRLARFLKRVQRSDAEDETETREMTPAEKVQAEILARRGHRELSVG